MSVNRYEFEDYGTNEDDGRYVTYEDYVALEARCAALLDELEAKDNRINRLEAIVAVAEQRNALMREWKRALKVPCDLVDDQVPVVIHGMVIRLERLKETEAKLEAAEKRIAELEATQGKPVMFIDGDISPVDAEKLAAVIREFNEETETPAARMARIIRENPHPTNMCDMPVAAAGKGEAS